MLKHSFILASLMIASTFMLNGCGSNSSSGSSSHSSNDDNSFGCYSCKGFGKASAFGGVSQPTRIHIGKAYTIKGKRYYPKRNDSYNKTGLASWYGPGFHGRKTANGEKYDQYAMTAAHKTLPLPSIVRVTNLKTGKSIKVRLNDRGPFAHGRIIDLSKAAAKKLGTIKSGVSRVRVQYLKADTKRYLASIGLKKSKKYAKKKPVYNKAYSPKNQQTALKAPARSEPIRRSSAPVFKVAMQDTKPIKSHIKSTTSQPRTDKDFNSFLSGLDLSKGNK